MRFFPSPELVRAYIEALNGYERFLITVGAGLVNSVLVWHGRIDQDTYEMLTLGTVAAYITAAAVTRVANIKAGGGDGRVNGAVVKSD